MSKSTGRKCKGCGKARPIYREGFCRSCSQVDLNREITEKRRSSLTPSPTSTVPLVSTLLTLDQVDEFFARGVNHQVLYQSSTAIVESVLDPATGLEVNRLVCVGNTWPDPPLAAVMRAGTSEES